MLNVANAVDEFAIGFVVEVLHGSSGDNERVIFVEDLAL